MPGCPNCGAWVGDTERDCPRCGTDVWRSGPPQHQAAGAPPPTPRRGAGLVVAVVLVALLVAGAAVALTLTRNRDKGLTLDGVETASELRAQLAPAVGPVTVRCPDRMAAKRGRIYDCVADDGTTSRIVRVTMDDSEGHYTYQVTNQQP
jgi:hypothetical protein